MTLSDEQLNTWIRRSLELFCRKCDRSLEFPCGVLTVDGVWEVRLCPDCEQPYTDKAKYWVDLKDATEMNP